MCLGRPYDLERREDEDEDAAPSVHGEHTVAAEQLEAAERVEEKVDGTEDPPDPRGRGPAVDESGDINSSEHDPTASEHVSISERWEHASSSGRWEHAHAHEPQRADRV